MRRVLSALSAAAIVGAGLMPLIGGVGTAEAATARVTSASLTVAPAYESANAAYTLTFTPAASEPAGDTITLSGSGGTTFPAAAGDYVVNGTPVSVAPSVSNGVTSSTVTLDTPVALTSGTAATLVISPVGTPATTPDSVTVATQTDTTPDAATATLATTSATQVGSPAVSLSSKAQAATGVTYTATFTATHAVGATITVGDTLGYTTPADGVGFVGPASDYIVNGTPATAVAVASSTTSTGAGSDAVTITVNPVTPGLAAGDSVTVEIQGVTNPPNTSTTTPLADTLLVGTSGDNLVAPTAPFEISATGTATSVTPSTTAPSVSPDTAGATGASYSYSFTTSATGALTAGSDTINVVAPAGTVLPATASDYVIDGSPASTVTQTGGTDAAQITDPITIGDNARVNVAISNVTNPAAGTYTLSESTSKDTTPVNSASYTIAAVGTQVSSVDVTSVNPNTASATNAQYTITFKPTTALTTAQANDIVITAPSGTVFTPGTNYTVNGVAATGSGSSNVETITVPTSVEPIAAGSTVTVVASGVANPSTASTTDTLTVATNLDTNPATSNDYTIAAAPTTTSVTTVKFSEVQFTDGTLGASYSQHAGVADTYSVNFVPTTGLVPGDTVTESFATGTVLPTSLSDYTALDGTTGSRVLVPVTAVSVSGTSATVTIGGGMPAGSTAYVVTSDVVNPPAGTTQNMSVSTSRDTVTVASSSPYPFTVLAAATQPTGVTFAATPTTAGSLATYTYTFVDTSGDSAGAAINLDGPTGAVFTGAQYTVNGATAVGTVGTSSTDTVSIAAPAAITAGSTVTVQALGVTNPSAGTYLTEVHTAGNPVGAYSNTVTFGSATTSLGANNVTVTNVAPSTAGAAAGYRITFPVPVGGDLAAGSGTITLSNFPAGTVLPTSGQGYSIGIVDTAPLTPGLGTQIEGQQPAAAVSHVTATSVTLTVPQGITSRGSTTVTVHIYPVTNPAASTTNTMEAATSSNTAPVLSGDYTTTAATAPSVTSLTPTSGPIAGGTLVTLTGSGFTGVTQVSFGSTVAPDFTVVSDTEIQVSSPTVNSSGSVPVTVTNSAGTSSASVLFTYTGTAAFTSETPTRIYDSRNTSPLVPGSPRTIQVSGLANVPSNATAVAVNVTAIQPTGVGNLRVYPAGDSTPNVSTVNYIPGQTVANYDIVGLSGGQMTLQTFGSTVNVAVDVTGYFVGTSAYTALPTPQRVLDTRPGSGLNQADLGPLMPGTAYPVQVTGLDGIPSSATSVAINVTAILPNTVGNLRVFPAGGTAPNASTVNYNPNNTVANFDIVKPVNGFIDVQTFNSDVNVAVDVVGYSTSLTTQVPVRILDTRPSSQIGSISGPVAPNTLESVQVAGMGGVPSNAAAVLMNVTAVGPSGVGNLRVFPDATAAPGASNINYIPGQDSANFVIVQLPADGKVDFESFGSSVNVLFDVVGYVPAGV